MVFRILRNFKSQVYNRWSRTTRIMFWVAIIFGLVSLISLILTMIPYFGEKVYVNPSKKIIPKDFGDYTFSFSIINKEGKDLNDKALLITYPKELFLIRDIKIKPKEIEEYFERYNKSFTMSLPFFAWEENGATKQIIFMGQTKEFLMQIDTRKLEKEDFVYFKIINILDYPGLKEIQKGFGGEFQNDTYTHLAEFDPSEFINWLKNSGKVKIEAILWGSDFKSNFSGV